MALDLPADLESVDVGKVNVEEHQIGRIFANGAKRLFACAGLFYTKTCTGQKSSARVATRIMVVDVQNPGRSHNLSRSSILFHRRNKCFNNIWQVLLGP